MSFVGKNCANMSDGGELRLKSIKTSWWMQWKWPRNTVIFVFAYAPRAGFLWITISVDKWNNPKKKKKVRVELGISRRLIITIAAVLIVTARSMGDVKPSGVLRKNVTQHSVTLGKHRSNRSSRSKGNVFGFSNSITKIESGSMVDKSFEHWKSKERRLIRY